MATPPGEKWTLPLLSPEAGALAICPDRCARSPKPAEPRHALLLLWPVAAVVRQRRCSSPRSRRRTVRAKAGSRYGQVGLHSEYVCLIGRSASAARAGPRTCFRRIAHPLSLRLRCPLLPKRVLGLHGQKRPGARGRVSVRQVMRKGARELHALHLTSFLPAAASALVLPAGAGEPGSSSSSANSGSPTGSRRAGSPSQVSISMLDLRYKDVRLEALWQAHRAASLQGLDCSALALCGTLQARRPLASARCQPRHGLPARFQACKARVCLMLQPSAQPRAADAARACACSCSACGGSGGIRGRCCSCSSWAPQRPASPVRPAAVTNAWDPCALFLKAGAREALTSLSRRGAPLSERAPRAPGLLSSRS